MVRKHIMPIKIIVFDFDDVVVLSEQIKQDSWFKIFPEYNLSEIKPKFLKAIEYYSKGKGSRFDILAMLFKFLGKKEEDIPALVEEYSNRYNTHVQRDILEKGVTDDNRDVLVNLSKKYRLYINSATPEEAIDETIENLDLKNIFTDVYGRPFSKIENLKRIAEGNNISPSEILFVGDGNGDYSASQDFGCHFIGVSTVRNKWNSKSFKLIQSLKELDDIIHTL